MSRKDPTAARFHSNVSDPYDYGVFKSFLQSINYMQRISQIPGDRGIRSGDHAEILEAVHRMGKLCSWGNKVRAAAERKMQEGLGLRPEIGVSMAMMVDKEAVLDVTRASRDLVSRLLSEDGKGKVDQNSGEGITDRWSHQLDDDGGCE